MIAPFLRRLREGPELAVERIGADFHRAFGQVAVGPLLQADVHQRLVGGEVVSGLRSRQHDRFEEVRRNARPQPFAQHELPALRRHRAQADDLVEDGAAGFLEQLHAVQFALVRILVLPLRLQVVAHRLQEEEEVGNTRRSARGVNATEQ